HALGVAPADVNPTPLPVDVLTAQPEQFFGAKSCAGSEYGNGLVARVELGCERLYLVPRLEREHVLALVALALRVANAGRSVVLQEAALVSPGERLPECAEDSVTRSGR